MIIRVSVDRQQAEAILHAAGGRLSFLRSVSEERFPTQKAEGYYEVIKELGIALLLLEGKKAVGENSHKAIFDELAGSGRVMQADAALIQDLRRRRNDSAYRGKPFSITYLAQHKGRLDLVIKGMRQAARQRLHDVTMRQQ